MRLIVILVTLLIVSYMIYQQIGPERAPRAPAVETEPAIQAPRIPQRVEDLRTFEPRMQQFMDESSQNRQRRLEEAEH